MAPDYFDHTSQVGQDGVKQLFIMGFKAWTGEFIGLPPSGNKITATAYAIYRIVNGKFIEGQFITDAAFLKQIGAIENTEQGKKLFPGDV